MVFVDVQLKAIHINQTFKPAAISAETARTRKFHWEEKGKDNGMVTVEDYFNKRYNMMLQ